jgi:hypothetical protein
VLDVVGNGREAGVDVAAVPLQLALYEILDVSAVGQLDPASPQEQIGEVFLLAGGPEQACLDELGGVDQFRLQSEQPEEQVAVSIHEGGLKNCRCLSRDAIRP